MFLAWTRYGQGPSGKYMLYVVLGERGGKIVCLDANKMPEDVVKILQDRNKVIDSMPIETKLSWIREVWPTYGSAYKEIFTTNVTIERKYPL